MTRSVSATISAAVAEDVTQPVYLIFMGWDQASPDIDRYVATWNEAISWNSLSWQASGVEVGRLDANGGDIRLPNGDDDPWLGLVSTQGQLGKSISIYEYHADFTASPVAYDATLLFTGVMDACTITDREIRISFVESLTHKHFPVSQINPTDYPYLLQPGQRLYWGPDIVLVK